MGKTKREEILERLLRETWECLPFVLTEDALSETNVNGLGKLADSVRAVLGYPPVELKIIGKLHSPVEVGKQMAEDRKLLDRLDTWAKGLSPAQATMLDSFMRRVFDENTTLTDKQRKIALEWDEHYVA